jgi:hypothetical protein
MLDIANDLRSLSDFKRNTSRRQHHRIAGVILNLFVSSDPHAWLPPIYARLRRDRPFALLLAVLFDTSLPSFH